MNGDTIVVDDKTGNLEARANVRTEMTLEEVDQKTGVRKKTPSIGEAEHFLYDDAKRLATYTGKARMIGSEGDVTAEKLELFLVSGANELERAGGIRREWNRRREGRGARRNRRAAHLHRQGRTYLMTGTPVEAVENTPPDCKKSVERRYLRPSTGRSIP